MLPAPEIDCDEATAALPRDLALHVLAYALPDRLEAFEAACRAGHLPLAQTLAAALALGAADIRADGRCDVLQVACRDGRLPVARWLAGHFGLTAEDVRAYDSWALRIACINGHLATVRWLVEHFDLSAADICAIAGGPSTWAASPLAWAAGGGHLAVVGWLAERFGLGPATPAPIREAGRAARVRGHTEVALWLDARLSGGGDTCGAPAPATEAAPGGPAG